MIEVTLKMNGELSRFLPNGEHVARLSVPEGSRIMDLVHQVEADGEVWLVAVNGKVSRLSAPVSAGDTIDCFSALEGG
jgi:sulfur carrier protein ThiS